MTKIIYIFIVNEISAFVFRCEFTNIDVGYFISQLDQMDRDPNYMYQYEYHSEANTLSENPTFINHGYQLPPPKPKSTVRKEV